MGCSHCYNFNLIFWFCNLNIFYIFYNMLHSHTQEGTNQIKLSHTEGAYLACASILFCPLCLVHALDLFAYCSFCKITVPLIFFTQPAPIC